MSDSAGVPWAGRSFAASEPSADDGSAPEKLIEALRRFREGELGESDVVDALRDARLLIPLVAVAGELGTSEHGHAIDKSQELSIVTVMGPDGRSVLPAFTSVAAMSAWNPAARPVPATAARVALAAASESTDLVVLDPTSVTEFALRRPALWALAQSQPWLPSYLDTDVLSAFMDAAEPEPSVAAVQLAPGDAGARLAGPELIVQLSLVPGLDRKALDDVVARLQQRWAEDELIASRVDSLALQLVSVQ
ncbi:MAG: SseB family protein [Rhodoglobus sp.]